jgi:ADP-ribose pyrophosphatase
VEHEANGRDPALPMRLGRTTLYESFWVTLHRDRVLLPTGRVLEAYHVLDLGPGAVVVLVLNEWGEVLLERVARYPTGAASWELPAGGIDAGEGALEAARREVREETGYDSTDHRLLCTYHPLNGISGLQVHVVACQAGREAGGIDRDEVAEIRWFTRPELAGLLARHEITDGLALIGLLLHLRECGDGPPAA